MAEVYRRVAGMSLEEAMARSSEAQDEIRPIVAERAARARAQLDAHRDSGDSFIESEHVDGIDWLVTLNDTRGQKAAMTIEKGRRRYAIGPRTPDTPRHGHDKNDNIVGRMAGVRPLGVAFDLPDDREEF